MLKLLGILFGVVGIGVSYAGNPILNLEFDPIEEVRLFSSEPDEFPEPTTGTGDLYDPIDVEDTTATETDISADDAPVPAKCVPNPTKTVIIKEVYASTSQDDNIQVPAYEDGKRVGDRALGKGWWLHRCRFQTLSEVWMEPACEDGYELDRQTMNGGPYCGNGDLSTNNLLEPNEQKCNVRLYLAEKSSVPLTDNDAVSACLKLARMLVQRAGDLGDLVFAGGSRRPNGEYIGEKCRPEDDKKRSFTPTQNIVKAMYKAPRQPTEEKVPFKGHFFVSVNAVKTDSKVMCKKVETY